MIKRILSLFFAFLMCLSTVSVLAAEEAAQTEETPLPFTDVAPEDEAYDAIKYLTEKKIINGISTTEFAPEGNLKREEFAKILSGAFNLTNTSGAPVFTDVPYSSWYGKYTALAAASGLMMGVSDSQFGVGQTLSRQDLAVTLKRFADANKIRLEAENTVLYADSAQVSDYAAEAVTTLSSTGIMTAEENNCFEPAAEATRADTAVAVYNLMTLAEEQAADEEEVELVDFPGAKKLVREGPEPFIVEEAPSIEILHEDFEDNDYGILDFAYQAPGITVETEGGIDNSGCLKMNDTPHNGYFRFISGELNPGDYLTVEYNLRASNATAAKKIGGVGFAVYNGDTGEWMAETGNPIGLNNTVKETDWMSATSIVCIPTIENAPRPSSYRIHLVLQQNDKSADVWIDDVTLRKTIFSPMETVLMYPNYKGIIKGEGGKGDIRVRVFLMEQNGAYDLSTMNYTAEVVDENDKVYMATESSVVTDAMDVYFSSESLPMGGDYYVRSKLTDKETGELIQKSEWTIRKREKDFTTEYWVDEYNRLHLNGEPILQTRMYNTGGGAGNYEEAMNCVNSSAGHNLDVIAETGFGWTSLQSNPNSPWYEVFDEAAKHGIRWKCSVGSFRLDLGVINPSREGWTPTTLINAMYDHINFTKSLDNLSDYYMFDEENAVLYGEQFKYRNDIIAALDLDHPTNNAIDDMRLERPGVHAKTADICAIDNYPIFGLEDDDFKSFYTKLVAFRDSIPGRPYFIINQAFGWKSRGHLRETTQQEFRNQVFHSLCGGVCALDAYAYHDLKVDWPDTWEESYEGYMEVYDEVETIAPIYLSIEPKPYYQVRGAGEWLTHMSRRYDGKSYIFAVNCERAEKTAKFHLDGVTEMTGMYSKKTYKADEDGWITVDFDAIGTELFVYEQAEYKSPECELKYFGLMNEDGEGIVMTNSTDETPVIRVPECKKTVTFASVYSENAQLYLNGQAVEKEGEFSIEGIDAITVKVESEDGRFKTERTYRLERYAE